MAQQNYQLKVYTDLAFSQTLTPLQLDSALKYISACAIPNPKNRDDPYDLIFLYDTTRIDNVSKLEGIAFAYEQNVQTSTKTSYKITAVSLSFSDGFRIENVGWTPIKMLENVLTKNEFETLMALSYFAGSSPAISSKLQFIYDYGLHEWILKPDTKRSSSNQRFSFFNLKSCGKTSYEIYRIPSLLVERFEQDDSLLALQSNYFFKDSLLTIPYICIANDCKTVNTIDSLSLQKEIYALYPRYVDQSIDFSFGFDFTIKITKEDYVFCLEVPVENT